MTAIYKTWIERIDSGVFTKAQCNQWAAAVRPLAESLPPRGKKTALTDEEARDLMQRIYWRDGVRLTPEHEQQGLAWVRKYGEKRVGIPAEAVEQFGHFSFHGDASDVGSGSWPQYIPVWRINLLDGRSLDYYNPAWQSDMYSGSSSGPAWWWVQKTAEDLQPT